MKSVYLLKIDSTMGATKTEIYTSESIAISDVAKVLSHPARVMMLQYISNQDSCICSDLVEEIGLSQATISQHLKVINDAGLLKGNHKGTSKCYCIDIDRFEIYRKLLNTFFKVTKSNCC